eukprot:Transcript_13116.p4 GENE.Transcript_13116~~Transcript_13116.p4  ORF type:complete len:171 (-),score=22.02 Transcript_13116:118-630(-)
MGAPIHWQNVQMYFHGAWINILAMMILDGPTVRAHGVFFGYGPFAWANVLCTAAMGLVMAALLKFLDNMARVYAAAVSMMVALVASWPLFGIPISPQVCAQPAHWGEGASSFTCARVARLILVQFGRSHASAPHAQVAIAIVVVILSMLQYHLPLSFDENFDRGPGIASR